ncbi:MAG: SMP-30/gluconolactonase/LRE family protein, partial [Flavobacteriaceae bacterium]|nr:SMP-30/gluconolactonase/LRE family protein [Flavobacteriaceae bacterium]
LLLIGILFILFIINLFISTGFFRTITYSFNGEVVQKIPIVGAEDITLSVIDSFALVSATDRGVYPPSKEEFGGIHLLDLKRPGFQTKLLTPKLTSSFAPHGISMLKTDSVYTVLVVNHKPDGHSIEKFTFDGDQLIHQKTLTDPSMISPNDVVMIDENRFYFTNDHKYTEGFGRFLEDYGGRAISNVVYFDGEQYKEVANGIAYANGINFDSNRNLLFVASPRGFLINVYKRNENGSLNFIEDIPCGFGVDNIEIDSQGNLWVGGHPNLLRFASYAKGKDTTSPSEIVKITYKGTGDYHIEPIYLEDGTIMSGATVATPFGDYILTGNVMDKHFLVLKRNK